MKRAVISMVIASSMLVPAWALGAPGGNVGTYGMSLAGDPGIVMQDSTATMEVVITNTTSTGSASIGWIRIDVYEPLYYISLSNLPPAGWDVVEIKNAGLGQAYIIYEAQTSPDRLGPGESQTFDLVLTGSTDGPFIADVNDMTDIFSTVTVKENSGNKAGTFSGSPAFWTRYSLKPAVTATPASVGTGGFINVRVALINRSTVTQGSITALTPTVSGTGAVTLVSGPNPPSAAIDPGGVQMYDFVYQAVSSGTVLFTSRGTNGLSGAGAVSSPWSASGPVVIGDFTAQAQLDPLTVIDGQQVQARLTLTNNGSSALAAVTPHISTGGTAVMTLVAGPQPSGVGALGPGASQTFVWTYTVSGNVGDSYSAQVWGSSTTLTSNTATTGTGTLSAYSAAVTPDSVSSGASAVSLTFTVSNNGGLGVRKVRFNTPAGWVYSAGTPPAGWSVSSSGNPTLVSFSSGGAASDIPVGGSASYVLTFSTVPTVPSDTPYNFLVEIWDRGQNQLNKNPRGSLETTVIVTPYALNLVCTDPDGPPNQVADGIQYFDLLATLTLNTVPVSGANILFTTSAGSLAAGNVVTDGAGQAPNTVTAPTSTSPVNADVTVTYLGAGAAATCLFDPYGGLALDYIPGTLGPVSATAGSPAVVFSAGVINTGTANVNLDETSTYFIFDDTTAGGASTYQAFLSSSAPAIIPPGGTAVLTFLPADVDSGFLPGSFYPQLLLDDGVSSGLRPVSDPVTITGGGAVINIIYWRETIQ